MEIIIGRRATRSLVSAAVITALLATGAQAAMLANVEGSVSLNRGDGYRPTGGGPVVGGERVRTAKGSASIVYENGCSTWVGPHQTVAVLASPPPCEGAMATRDGGPAGPDLGSQPVLIGGLVVGGAVGLAIALGNNHDPHSP
jgi:hypothetical protein